MIHLNIYLMFKTVHTLWSTQTRSEVLTFCNTQTWVAGSLQLIWAWCLTRITVMACREIGLQPSPIPFSLFEIGLRGIIWPPGKPTYSPENIPAGSPHVMVAVQIVYCVRGNWGELVTHDWWLHWIGSPAQPLYSIMYDSAAWSMALKLESRLKFWLYHEDPLVILNHLAFLSPHYSVVVRITWGRDCIMPWAAWLMVRKKWYLC